MKKVKLPKWLYRIPLRVKLRFGIRISKDRYLHLPLLYLIIGNDGFILDVIGIEMQIMWGDAVRKKLN